MLKKQKSCKNNFYILIFNSLYFFRKSSKKRQLEFAHRQNQTQLAKIATCPPIANPHLIEEMTIEIIGINLI